MFCVSHIYVCRFVLVLDLHITSLSLHTHTCSLLTHCMQKPPKIRLTLHSWVRSPTRRGGGRPPVPNVRAIQYPTYLPHHSLSQYMGGSNLLLSASFCISRYSVRRLLHLGRVYYLLHKCSSPGRSYTTPLRLRTKSRINYHLVALLRFLFVCFPASATPTGIGTACTQHSYTTTRLYTGCG